MNRLPQSLSIYILSGIVIFANMVGCKSSQAPLNWPHRRNPAEMASLPQAPDGPAIAQPTPPHQMVQNAMQQPPIDPQRQIAEHLKQGYAALEKEKLEVAKIHFESVRQLEPLNSSANHRLGIIADKQSDFINAERYYQTALIQSPTQPDILSDLGYSYILQGKFALGQDYLNRALSFNPNHSKALNNLGLLYAKTGDAASALATFRQAGTEKEALAKMAQLFPNRPDVVTAAAQVPANTVSHVDPKSGEPINFRPMKVANADGAIARSTPVNSIGTSGNQSFSQIQQMMAQQKARAVAQRNQAAAMPVIPQRFSHNNMTTSHQQRTGRLADSQISNAFEMIDQANQPRKRPRIINAGPNLPSNGQVVTPNSQGYQELPPAPIHTNGPSIPNQMMAPQSRSQLPAPDPRNPLNAVPTLQPNSLTHVSSIPRSAIPSQSGQANGTAEIWHGSSRSSVGIAQRQPTQFQSNNGVQHASFTSPTPPPAATPLPTHHVQNTAALAAARQGMNAGGYQPFPVPNQSRVANTTSESSTSNSQAAGISRTPTKHSYAIIPGESLPPGSSMYNTPTTMPHWNLQTNTSATDKIKQFEDRVRRENYEVLQLRQRTRAEEKQQN